MNPRPTSAPPSPTPDTYADDFVLSIAEAIETVHFEILGERATLAKAAGHGFLVGLAFGARCPGVTAHVLARLIESGGLDPADPAAYHRWALAELYRAMGPELSEAQL